MWEHPPSATLSVPHVPLSVGHSHHLFMSTSRPSTHCVSPSLSVTRMACLSWTCHIAELTGSHPEGRLYQVGRPNNVTDMAGWPSRGLPAGATQRNGVQSCNPTELNPINNQRVWKRPQATALAMGPGLGHAVAGVARLSCLWVLHWWRFAKQLRRTSHILPHLHPQSCGLRGLPGDQALQPTPLPLLAPGRTGAASYSWGSTPGCPSPEGLSSGPLGPLTPRARPPEAGALLPVPSPPAGVIPGAWLGRESSQIPTRGRSGVAGSLRRRRAWKVPEGARAKERWRRPEAREAGSGGLPGARTPKGSSPAGAVWPAGLQVCEQTDVRRPELPRGAGRHSSRGQTRLAGMSPGGWSLTTSFSRWACPGPCWGQCRRRQSVRDILCASDPEQGSCHFGF